MIMGGALLYKPILMTLAMLAGAMPDEPPAEITSQSVPAIAEASWAFSHDGNLFLVGKETGRVQIVRGHAPPPDDTRPKPPPPPAPTARVKWFSVVVDPNDPAQAAWRTSAALRAALAGKSVEFRTYASNEQDIDTLGFRPHLTQAGTPMVILQDAAGNLVQMVVPKSMEDVQKIAESIK